MAAWVGVAVAEHVARGVDWEAVTPAPVRPLLDRLSFVTDRRGWGMAFRRGLFRVPAEDFAVIEGALRDG